MFDRAEILDMLAADLVFVTALAFVVGCNLYFAPRVGDRIAMQWGIDGKPTWHAPRQVALWGMVGFMLATRLCIWTAMIYWPDIVHGEEFGVLAFSIIAAASHLYVLTKASRSSQMPH